MATRFVGVDSADPRLPQGVIDASQGTTHADLAPGDVLAEANAYTDSAIASLPPPGISETDADARFVNTDGDAMTGPLVLPADPTADLEAATKAYVDAAVTGAGGMPPGGDIDQVLTKASATDFDTVWADPPAGGGGITEPEADARFVNVDGDTMTGDLVLQGFGLDGAAFISTDAAGSLWVGTAGIESTGPVVLLAGDPVQPLHAATKQYVDGRVVPGITQAEADARFVNVTGDAMSGQLALAGDPVGTNDATRKSYVDAQVATQTTRVNRLFSDTGWQQLTIDPNWSGAANVTIRRQGGTVSLIFAPSRNAAGGPSDMIPFVVPVGFRASVVVRGVAWITGPAAPARFTIGTDGTFTIFAATFNTGAFLQGSASWLIDIP
jgi:hypothetical protein